jgi:hypothetical protein
MTEKQLSDGNPDGTTLGQSASDLVAFHGSAPVDQAASIALATNATIGSANVAIRSIITALVEKGLLAGGPG